MQGGCIIDFACLEDVHSQRELAMDKHAFGKTIQRDGKVSVLVRLHEKPGPFFLPERLR
jgi:hypothetical protein